MSPLRWVASAGIDVVRAPAVTRMIISVHIPKTAGTSFLRILERNLGGAILFEYHNHLCDELLASFRGKRVLDEAQKSRLREYVARKEIRCIHGHFSSSKYLDLFDGTRLITFLREPTDRLLSEYYFHREHNWEQQIAKGVIKPEDYLLGYRVHIGEVSLEDFLLHDDTANYYTERYGLDRTFERFAFIGIVEELEVSLGLLQQKVPELADVSAVRTNVTKQKDLGAADLDPGLLARVHERNEPDYRLYRAARQLLRAEAS